MKGNLYQHKIMATNNGNLDRIEADVHDGDGNNDGNREGVVPPPGSHHGDEDEHADGGSNHGNGGGESEEETDADTIGKLLAEMPTRVRTAADKWGSKMFINALIRGVDLQYQELGEGKSTDTGAEKAEKNSKRRPSSSDSEFHGCDFKERTIPVTEVLKIMREERRAERASCENQARRSAIPPRPSSYDGLSSGEHFLEEFIFYIENSGPGTPHHTDFTNSFAAFLTDRAKIWYKRLPATDQHNWNTLLTLFKADFVEHFREEARDAYKHRCQGPSESVESYSNDMDRLLSAAGLSQEEMLAIYIANLRSAIRRHVRNSKPKNIREAERIAMEKEADIKESINYYPASEGTPTDSEDQLLNRLLDRVQTLTSNHPSPPPEPKKSTKEVEEALLSKLLAKIQALQPTGKQPAPKNTLAQLSSVKPTSGKKKGAAARKKKAAAQEVNTPAQPAMETPPSPAQTPVYNPMPYPFYNGPMMPPMQPFQGPGFYPYPPPGYGSQVSTSNQAQSQSPMAHNQGN